MLTKKIFKPGQFVHEGRSEVDSTEQLRSLDKQTLTQWIIWLESSVGECTDVIHDNLHRNFAVIVLIASNLLSDLAENI